jgi:hypothetical protein
VDLVHYQLKRSASSSRSRPTAEYPICGGRMIIIETFEAGCHPHHRPTTPLAVIRIDTS